MAVITKDQKKEQKTQTQAQDQDQTKTKNDNDDNDDDGDGGGGGDTADNTVGEKREEEQRSRGEERRDVTTTPCIQTRRWRWSRMAMSAMVVSAMMMSAMAMPPGEGCAVRAAEPLRRRQCAVCRAVSHCKAGGSAHVSVAPRAHTCTCTVCSHHSYS